MNIVYIPKFPKTLLEFSKMLSEKVLEFPEGIELLSKYAQSNNTQSNIQAKPKP